jgi:arginyl-tRNA synthetase
LKAKLATLVQQALSALYPAQAPMAFTIENTKNPTHGDLACNVAMIGAKTLGKNPRQLATDILAALPANTLIEKAEIAGPGFINFFLRAEGKTAALAEVLAQQTRYGMSDVGQKQRITIEYVSANPTGPLHVGHGRGAAYGSALCNIMAAAGYDVQREYYVNDYGRQMDIMTCSLWLRYLQQLGQNVRFPDNGYKGSYVSDIARALQVQHADAYALDAAALLQDLPPDETQCDAQGQPGDKEVHVDALIAAIKAGLGAERYRAVYDFALSRLQAAIKAELELFNVHHDVWFSERSLAESGAITQVVQHLQARGEMLQKDGALWFAASKYGDEKDRVVQRENGQSTYFASDIAYLKNKFDRGFAHAIYVLGADHHGYIARLKAAASGLGIDPARVEITLVQFARLFKDGKEVAMGKREGLFVTLSDLREEVGTDAARFFYVMRSHEQHLDFDLELAKKQSADNPVYYVQYAHARICRVFERIAERGFAAYDQAQGLQHLQLLGDARELDLITQLGLFPETVAKSAQERAPHRVVNYLRELAALLHGVYDAPPRLEILAVDDCLRNARLALMAATRQVLQNGLKLLGVSAPESM